VLGPCDGFVPGPGSAHEGGSCERCLEQVHDVSAMRESELRQFLAARAGTRVCVSYRTDADGRLLLRPEAPPASGPPALAVGALALLLAACAGPGRALEAPEPGCPVLLTMHPTMQPTMHLAEPDVPSHHASPGAAPTSAKHRVDFSIDPAASFRRVIGFTNVDEGWRPLHFTPTAELVEDWQYLRGERVAARRRWRTSQRVATSR
jgi:hypothetical protein